MTNQIKCPGCGWTLEYDPALGKFCCIYCNTAYTVAELKEMHKEEKESEIPSGVTPPTKESEALPGATPPGMESVVPSGAIPPKTESEDPVRNRLAMPAEGIRKVRGTIPMTVLTCRSCGAELMMNRVETSSFCAYCGQATIASERLEDWLEPDSIIPFSVTKEEAEKIIRTRLQAGSFIPDGIKNFETERLRGIYIPYWLFDVYCADNQSWKYSSGRSSAYAHRVAECEFKNITTEASERFVDEYSMKLEPFNTAKRIPFHPAYLSGFYSDRFDVSDEKAESIATRRATQLFDREVMATIPGSDKELEHSEMEPVITREEYSMLPVWFLTFRYQDNPYTILVNGQTRKMVGAVPYVKKKAAVIFAILAAILCPIFSVVFSYVTYFAVQGLLEGTEDSFKVFAYYIAFIAVLFGATWVSAIRKHDQMKRSIGLTCATSTNRFVKERQDR